ncbi:MAG TPA: hypothetical protein PK511_12030 [Chitinophagales bacterium]|nr:hypothetical protein [Chitinophagales bacterium]HMZ88887.1 hypothetical protein [Chitinophagales bacterium]HNA57637.1 hypothetical protein [Chitinophagales bacterium]HNE46004.1 hypothetical protein [Chitinophagales bacterium]HNF69980.1 hypothetical protein [Chitinophagales bacterium]
MKKLLMPVLLAAGLVFATAGYSQDAVKFDQHFQVQLTDAMLQSGSVVMDISDLQFTDEAAAQKYFNAIRNNLVEFTLDYSAHTVTMHLYPERLGKHTWTLSDWNAYLANMAERNAETYQSFQISSPKQ